MRPIISHPKSKLALRGAMGGSHLQLSLPAPSSCVPWITEIPVPPSHHQASTATACSPSRTPITHPLSETVLPTPPRTNTAHQVCREARPHSPLKASVSVAAFALKKTPMSAPNTNTTVKERRGAAHRTQSF